MTGTMPFFSFVVFFLLSEKSKNESNLFVAFSEDPHLARESYKKNRNFSSEKIEVNERNRELSTHAQATSPSQGIVLTITAISNHPYPDVRYIYTLFYSELQQFDTGFTTFKKRVVGR